MCLNLFYIKFISNVCRMCMPVKNYMHCQVLQLKKNHVFRTHVSMNKLARNIMDFFNVQLIAKKKKVNKSKADVIV